MKIQWYMWAGLALILAPGLQTWIAQTYPQASYPLAGLAVLLIAGVAKWLELLAADHRAKTGEGMPQGQARGALDAGDTPGKSKVKRLFWDN